MDEVTQTEFNFEAAEAAKVAGMKLAEDGASDLMKDTIRRAILKVANERPDFTTADVRLALGDYYKQIPEPRVLGTIMKQLQKAREIQPTDMVRPSGLKINHNFNQRIWKKVR